MKIYKQEVKDGLSNLIKANSTLAYSCPLMKFGENGLREELVKAFIENDSKINQIDLYPIYSVLVSCGWNKNDEIFDIAEVWNARKTPEDKPFNLMHNQIDIIGHITANYAVDAKFNKIDDNIPIDSLPNKFHIITAAVIYTFWEDKTRQRQIAKIIEEIESGNKWFVSMECLFKNFDYGLINAKGEMKVLPRDESTAGLTKRLRAYGGNGKFEDYKIGRVLRNITFCGKGLVDNPANPESIIFENVNSLTSVFANVGYMNLSDINKQEINMTDYSNIEKLILDLRNDLNKSVSLESKIAELSNSVASVETEKVGLEKQIAELSEKVATYETAAKDKKEKDEEMEKEMCSLKAENEAMKKTLEEYKKAEKHSKRAEAISKFGLSSPELIDSLSDEAFDVVVKAMSDAGIKVGGGGIRVVESEKEDKKVEESNVTPNDLISSASTTDSSNLGVSITDQFDKVQADILTWFNSNRGE